MNLFETQKKFLRGLGHQLKPIILVGDAGLTEALLKEFCSTIEHHELIKVRINAADRAALADIAAKLSEACQASLVQIIGHIAVIYRKNPKK